MILLFLASRQKTKRISWQGDSVLIDGMKQLSCWETEDGQKRASMRSLHRQCNSCQRGAQGLLLNHQRLRRDQLAEQAGDGPVADDIPLEDENVYCGSL